MLFGGSTSNFLAILLLGPVVQPIQNHYSGKNGVEYVQPMKHTQMVREPLVARRIKLNGEDSNDR